MNIFKQYKGLRPELYNLFRGRVATNMGVLIWSTLTLKLKNKLGYIVGEAAKLILLLGILMLPATHLGANLQTTSIKRQISSEVTLRLLQVI